MDSIPDTSPPKSILVISLAKILTGHPVSTVIAADWAKPKASIHKEKFDVQGFDLNSSDIPTTLKDLKSRLQRRNWDGVLVGWCTRGYPERTVLFEQVIAVCVDAMKDGNDMKLLFNTGPEDLVEPVVRNFTERKK